MVGIYTPGLPAAAFPLTGNEQAAFDTTLPSGETPETEAITLSQIRGFERPPLALTDAATITTNATNANFFTVTLGGNRTLANPTNLQTGGTYIWEVTQDATGARTLAYGTLFKFSGASTLSTSASQIDMLTCRYDGTILLCTLATKFA